MAVRTGNFRTQAVVQVLPDEGCGGWHLLGTTERLTFRSTSPPHRGFFPSPTPQRCMFLIDHPPDKIGVHQYYYIVTRSRRNSQKLRGWVPVVRHHPVWGAGEVSGGLRRLSRELSPEGEEVRNGIRNGNLTTRVDSVLPPEQMRKII